MEAGYGSDGKVGLVKIEYIRSFCSSRRRGLSYLGAFPRGSLGIQLLKFNICAVGKLTVEVGRPEKNKKERKKKCGTCHKTVTSDE